MSTAVLTNRIELSSVADKVLRIAEGFWFVVTVLGQIIFAVAVATFYGMTAVRGDYHGWRFSHGFVPGVTMGNLAVATHLISAVIIMLAGAVQLVPQVRKRFPAFHRWNGRIYMFTGVALSVAGMYMVWFRGSVGDLPQHLGSTLNAVLIWFCAAVALRYALARNFTAHRRWALRFFIVLSASWFYRIMFFLFLMVFKSPVGFDPNTFTGPFLTFMAFAQYLIPLAFLELYLRAQDRPGVLRRLAAAGMLVVCTLAMAAGLFAVTMGFWIPDVKAGFDPRKSIAATLSDTIKSVGIEQAVKQYHDLKATQASAYNFDEEQLNGLGYQLLGAHKVKDALRIFQLNVEAYPQSSNAYDSLGEGYMDDGDKADAITYYKKSLQLNPKNHNGEVMLEKLGAR